MSSLPVSLRFSRSSIQLLRIPFSFVLAPTFLWAWSTVPSADLTRVGVAFLVIHLFLYPASHAYNSFFDRDTGSIGGIEQPPEVTQDLIGLALILDILALAGSAWLGWKVFLIAAAYTLSSKAYSHPRTRWKARPWLSWFVVMSFQGAGTFLMTYFALGGETLASVWSAALASSLLIGSFYPLSQVYQHKEDGERGDMTLSRRLGVRGTFVFSTICSSLALALVGLWAFGFGGQRAMLWTAAVFTLPASYLGYWMLSVWRNPALASFRALSRMNLISAGGMTVWLTGLFLMGF